METDLPQQEVWLKVAIRRADANMMADNYSLELNKAQLLRSETPRLLDLLQLTAMPSPPRYDTRHHPRCANYGAHVCVQLSQPGDLLELAEILTDIKDMHAPWHSMHMIDACMHRTATATICGMHWHNHMAQVTSAP